MATACDPRGRLRFFRRAETADGNCAGAGKDPSVLIMDEATSALDVMTEQKVMDAVRRRGMTCVVIAASSVHDPGCR